MKVHKGARRDDGTLWAQGPVRVPESHNMPPIGWGTESYPDWEKRVAAWRERPAKERLACTEARQVQDPTMPEAASTRKGVIRWSNGHGVWPNHHHLQYKCFKRGYWINSGSYGTPRFIGEDINDVIAYLDAQLDNWLAYLSEDQKRAYSERDGAIDSIATFEAEVLGPKVLDLLSEID